MRAADPFRLLEHHFLGGNHQIVRDKNISNHDQTKIDQAYMLHHKPLQHPGFRRRGKGRYILIFQHGFSLNQGHPAGN